MVVNMPSVAIVDPQNKTMYKTTFTSTSLK